MTPELYLTLYKFSNSKVIKITFNDQLMAETCLKEGIKFLI